MIIWTTFPISTRSLDDSKRFLSVPFSVSDMFTGSSDPIDGQMEQNEENGLIGSSSAVAIVAVIAALLCGLLLSLLIFKRYRDARNDCQDDTLYETESKDLEISDGEPDGSEAPWDVDDLDRELSDAFAVLVDPSIDKMTNDNLFDFDNDEIF
jgi:hypothetical protein